VELALALALALAPPLAPQLPSALDDPHLKQRSLLANTLLPHDPHVQSPGRRRPPAPAPAGRSAPHL
jgi:hypothetical protein